MVTDKNRFPRESTVTWKDFGLMCRNQDFCFMAGIFFFSPQGWSLETVSLLVRTWPFSVAKWWYFSAVGGSCIYNPGERSTNGKFECFFGEFVSVRITGWKGCFKCRAQNRRNCIICETWVWRPLLFIRLCLTQCFPSADCVRRKTVASGGVFVKEREIVNWNELLKAAQYPWIGEKGICKN